MTGNFWDDQPPAARAVVDLAAYRESNHPDDAHDRILATLLTDDAADTVRQIADDLYWIGRLETENARDVLGDYHERPVFPIHADLVADELAAELRAGVVTAAQLVASLAVRRAA